METIVWTAITIAVLLLAWALAPYHQRIIENRPAPAQHNENWD
jgi:hypothetical protein